MSTYNTAKYAAVFPAHITAKHAAVCTAFWATIDTAHNPTKYLSVVPALC